MSSTTLNLLYGEELIGELNYHHNDDSFNFSYDESWKKNGFEISPHIKFDDLASSATIKRFLLNLFPEGNAFDHLIENFRLSKDNVIGIVRAIGRDTTGAITILDSSKTIENSDNSLREVTLEEIYSRLSDSEVDLTIWDDQPRLSIAGLQDKLPVFIGDDGKFYFGDGDIASTHILKFQTTNKKNIHLVLNELYCMKLAKRVGALVANTKFLRIKDHPVLVVERFDREKVSDNLVKRYHIIDGCQALDLLPSFKYERNFGSGRDVKDIREGVSLPKLFGFCKSCSVPAKAIKSSLEWFVFNLLISNYDNHGKNISYMVSKGGISPAPMYDLVNISMYSHLSQDLAMAIGEEFDSNQIFDYQLADMCEEINIPRRLFVKELNRIGESVLKYCNSVKDSIVSDYHLEESEIKFLEKLTQSVENKTKHYIKISQNVLTVEL